MLKWIPVCLVLLCSLQPGPATAGEMDRHQEDDDPLLGMFLADELEWQKASGDDVLAWNVSAWLGHDTGRLLFRSEGEAAKGEINESRSELLLWKPVAAWWDLVGGLRQDAGPGPGRTYALVGVQGLTPYRFHLEADLFAGERGQVGTRVESRYELLLTNRLVLEPRAEFQAFGRDDAATGTGRGLSRLKAGLRLRYEIRREFAPYLGVEWSGSIGDTADYARVDNEPVRDTRLLAGLRFWF